MYVLLETQHQGNIHIYIYIYMETQETAIDVSGRKYYNIQNRIGYSSKTKYERATPYVMYDPTEESKLHDKSRTMTCDSPPGQYSLYAVIPSHSLCETVIELSG